MRAAWVPICMQLVGCSELLGVHDFEPTSDAMLDARSDAASDAAPPDASPFDVADCPASYVTISTLPGSRYRLITTPHTARQHHEDCADDSLGFTHLAVLSSDFERDRLGNLLEDGTHAVIGMVQRRNQGGVKEGWIDLAGNAVASSVWDAGQPDDANGEETSAEQFARLSSLDKVSDIPGTATHEGICECDGVAVTDEAATLFEP